MTDLLERLAELLKQEVYDTPTIREAKAEIERLQAELQHWEGLDGQGRESLETTLDKERKAAREVVAKLQADEEKQQKEYDSLWDSFCEMRAALEFYADTYGPGTELGDPAHNALNPPAAAQSRPEPPAADPAAPR